MKKFLSLALALIMTMSLVTIGTSATFTDDDAISYSEAVDVMAAVEVIGGYADGSFAPEATLTRGAAAKIICNLVLGPTTAGALVADAAPFPDVATSHVFAGYIAYCANQGILSGYADGNFVPDGTVTGFQFMKMLLVALGYDSDIEGFTGDNWSINVAKLASSLDLDDGNEDYVGTAAMTREEACLYGFNLLQATMVEYDSNSSISVGDIVITSSSTAKEVTTSSDKATISKDGYVQFAEKYFSDLEVDYGNDDFGRPVTSWDLDGDDIGSYVDHNDLEAAYEGKVTKATMYTLLGSSLYGDLTDQDASLVVWVDGVEKEYVPYASEGTDYTDEVEYVAKKSSTSSIQNEDGTVTVTGNSSYTEVYLTEDSNGNDVVTVVVINTHLVQATADYSTSNEYLKIDNLSGHASSYANVASVIYNEDVNVEDFEEDDYILVTIAAGEIQTAELAEVITGTVSAYTSETSVTVDGTKYSYNLTIDDKTTGYSVGDDASLVIDQYGNVIYVDDAVVDSDNYVFVTEFASSGTFGKTFYAAAYFADGSYEEIELDEVYGQDIDSDLSAAVTDGSKLIIDTKVTNKTIDDTTTVDAAVWFTYSANSDGTYDLSDIDEDFTVATEVTGTGSSTEIITNSKTAFADGAESNSLKGDSSTVFVIVDEDGDIYMATGISNVPDVTVTGSYSIYAINDGSYAEFVFVDASNATSSKVDDSESTSTDYVMILTADGDEDVSTDANGDKYYTYEAWVDGEIVDIDADSDGIFDDGVGSVYNNIKISGDYVTEATLMKDEGDGGDDGVYVVNFLSTMTYIDRSSDILQIGTEYFILEDTEIIFVTSDTELMSDDNADYEWDSLTSAKAIMTALDDYNYITGSYVAISEDENENIDTLFLYVTGGETRDAEYTVSLGEAASLNNLTATLSSVDDKLEEGNSTTVTVTLTSGVIAGAATTFTISATSGELTCTDSDAGWAVRMVDNGDGTVSLIVDNGTTISLGSNDTRDCTFTMSDANATISISAI